MYSVTESTTGILCSSDFKTSKKINLKIGNMTALISKNELRFSGFEAIEY